MFHRALGAAVALLLICSAAVASAQEQAAPGQTSGVVFVLPGNLEDFDRNQPIRPGFVLSIFVSTTMTEEQVSGAFTVDPSGAVVMKLVGRVEVQGLTPEQAAARIAEAYKDYLKEPKVTVAILSVPRPIIYMSGAVTPQRRGAIMIHDRSTLAEVLAVVGYTDDADLSRVRIVSRDGDTRTTKEVDFNRWMRPSAGQPPDESQNPVLKDRDLVFVPSKSILPVGEVIIQGDVVRGGPVPIRYSTSTRLREAIALAGGLNPTAATMITIRRPGVDQPIVVDWEKAEAGDPAHNVEIYPEDVIYVPRIGVEQAVLMVGALPRAGRLPYRRKLTLTEAVGEAGGVVLHGKEKVGHIFRHPTPGDPSRTQVIAFNLNEIREGRAPDIALQPGDTVEIRPGEAPRRYDWIQIALSALTVYALLRR